MMRTLPRGRLRCRTKTVEDDQGNLHDSGNGRFTSGGDTSSSPSESGGKEGNGQRGKLQEKNNQELVRQHLASNPKGQSINQIARAAKLHPNKVVDALAALRDGGALDMSGGTKYKLKPESESAGQELPQTESPQESKPEAPPEFNTVEEGVTAVAEIGKRLSGRGFDMTGDVERDLFRLGNYDTLFLDNIIKDMQDTGLYEDNNELFRALHLAFGGVKQSSDTGGAIDAKRIAAKFDFMKEKFEAASAALAKLGKQDLADFYGRTGVALVDKTRQYALEHYSYKPAKGFFRYLTKAFDESEHPRGQPKNAGQFAKTPAKKEGGKEPPGRGKVSHTPHASVGAARHTRVPTVYPVGQKPPQRGRIPTVYPEGVRPHEYALQELKPLIEQYKKAGPGSPTNVLRRKMVAILDHLDVDQLDTLAGDVLDSTRNIGSRRELTTAVVDKLLAGQNLAAKPAPKQQQKPQDNRDLYHAEATKTFDAALDRATHLPEATRREYREAAQKVLDLMPEKALLEVAANLKDVDFYPDRQSLSDAAFKQYPGLKERIESVLQQMGRPSALAGSSVGGLCKVDGSKLFLDGHIESPDDIAGKSRTNVQETYAHELAHSVDGNRKYSNDNEWLFAWQEEIARGGLSLYATTSAVEGFAELGRLAYGTAIDRKTVESMFPKCVGFWKKMGLWDDSGGRGTTPQSGGASSHPGPSPSISTQQKYSVASTLSTSNLNSTLGKLDAALNSGVVSKQEHEDATAFARAIDKLYKKRDGFVPQKVRDLINKKQ